MDNDPENDTDDEEDNIEQRSTDDYHNNIEARDDEIPNGDNNYGTGFGGANEDNFVGQQSGNEEEDSVYDFASERSVYSSDEESEQPISDLQYAAEKLFTFFQGDVGGCTEEQHNERRRQHMASIADDDHHSLDDIFNEPDTLSVLASSNLLTFDRLAHHILPTPQQLQSIFCGISPQQPRPQHVCLHQEETRAQSPRQSFDIDSLLGFLHSLAACREGLWHQPAP